MSGSDVLVILPAFNEEENITGVIQNIFRCVPEADILVIDDGSTDMTAPLAKEAGAIVLSLPYNVGIGAAVQTGFQFADSHHYDRVVRNDSDGQHSPDDIKCLLEKLEQEQLDVVIGSRFLGKNGDYGTSRARLAGIGILSRLISFIIKQKVTDPTSGFCAFNQTAIQLFARVYPHDYPEPEAMVIMSRAGLRMQEVPVTMKAREHGQSSITPIRSVYYMLKVTLAVIITALRHPPELN